MCHQPHFHPPASFQAKVSAKEASHLYETRWPHERLAGVLRDPAALKAWARDMVPDTISEAWSILMVLVVGGFVVSCIQALSQKAYLEENEENAEGQRRWGGGVSGK